MNNPDKRQLSAMRMMLENMSAMDASDYYELLITTGRLRVVDCTYEERTYGPVTYSVWNCSRHGELLRCKENGSGGKCIGCGNPIKE